jgi:hypothetical protein
MCPGGEQLLETKECPSKTCPAGFQGNITVPTGQDCPEVRSCPGETSALASVQCPTKDCPGGAVVKTAEQCPATRSCPDGAVVLATAQCGAKACPGGAIIKANEECPKAVACPGGSIVFAPQSCPTKLCPGEAIVRTGAQCPSVKACADKRVVLVDQDCASQPACWTCKFYPLTSDTIPHWAALLGALALIGGAVAGAAKLGRLRVLRRTQKLFSMNGSIDTAAPPGPDDPLVPDGPSIRLRSYFGPEDLQDG